MFHEDNTNFDDISVLIVECDTNLPTTLFTLPNITTENREDENSVRYVDRMSYEFCRTRNGVGNVVDTSQQCRRHKIIMDWIDIDPDRSQAIWYCETCGHTSEKYNKDTSPVLNGVSLFAGRTNVLSIEKENRLKKENDRKLNK